MFVGVRSGVKSRNAARISAIALAIGTAAAVVLVLWTLSDGGAAQEPPPESTTHAGSVPAGTPALLRLAPSIEEGEAKLRSSAPGAADLLDAARAADVKMLLDHVAWESNRCDEFVYRGTTACEVWHVASGSVIQSMRPDGSEVDVQRTDVEAALTYFLRDRNPRPQLIARRDDGAYLLSFAIEPRPGLLFPGRLPEGGAPVGTWYVLTSAQGPGAIATYGYAPVGGLPLDFVRVDEFRGTHRYEILGASEEFRAAEQSAHDAQEKANRTP